jgi:hypothetical protein
MKSSISYLKNPLDSNRKFNSKENSSQKEQTYSQKPFLATPIIISLSNVTSPGR